MVIAGTAGTGRSVRVLGYFAVAIILVVILFVAVGALLVRLVHRPPGLERRRHRRPGLLAPIRRRVSAGDRCPSCGTGTVYEASSSTYGSFLGCTNFQGGAPGGCWRAWTLDGRRIRQPQPGMYHIDP